MNPCRCGMAGEPGHVCRRGQRCVDDYQARLSGPFLDRIDIRIEVPAVSEFLSPIPNVVALQLFAYFVATKRGCNVDQPRNLAKSVTVE